MGYLLHDDSMQGKYPPLFTYTEVNTNIIILCFSKLVNRNCFTVNLSRVTA